MANVGDDDIVMDFFAGSSTTAHSVMQLNFEDGLRRHFVLVQLDEDLDEALKHSSGKRKMQIQNAVDFLEEHSMRHSLCQIGEERIRRAGNKFIKEIDAINLQMKIDEKPKQKLDSGFRVFRIDSSNFRNTHSEPGELIQSSLYDFIDNLKSDRAPEDLLIEVLPKFRIPYSAKIDNFNVDGSSCFNVNDGQLIACFDTEVSTKVIEEIARMRPIYAVFRDASMADDSAAANFEELFRTYSPDTIRRVI